MIRPVYQLIFLVFLILKSLAPAFSAPIIRHDFGGRIMAQGSLNLYDEASFMAFNGDRRGADHDLSLRLTDSLRLGNRWSVNVHYEAVGAGGHGHEARKTLPSLFSDRIPRPAVDDRRRLMNLTDDIRDTKDYLLYHRLDRLSVSYRGPWGECRVGRQALTWGNGLIFNPMDVFNPFAPTDTERDYKVGDDLVAVSVNTGTQGDLHLIHVPRRDPDTGRIQSDQASWALRQHLFLGNAELDVLGARHVDEVLTGLGLSGSLGQATIRSDLIWSGLSGSRRQESGYLSLIINIDRSWVIRNHNVYGLLEYYHNGLGHHEAERGLIDPDVIERIRRGDLFVLGRNYLGGLLQIELHPLLSVTLHLITSLDDGSAVIQPRLIWDAGTNTRIQWGFIVYQGHTGSEFGGLAIPGTHLTTAGPHSMVLTVSWFF